MKKVILGIFVTGMIALTSCTHNTVTLPATSQGGTWTIKGRTYNAVTCALVNNQSSYKTIEANDTVDVGFPGVDVAFSHALPVQDGVYTVVNNTPSTNEVMINVSIFGPGTYYSVGGNATQKVNVTVSNNLVSISGSGILVANEVPSNPDTATLTLNLHQLR